MKKILVLILIMMITGCQNNDQLNDNKKKYDLLVKELTNTNIKNDILPFDIEVKIDKLITSEITYRIIIDNPSEAIKNITILAIHNYPTEDIYPSLGIFDSKVNLIPNKVDINKNNVKGIALVGYIPYEQELTTFKGTFKVIIEYLDHNNKKQKKYYQYQN